MATQKPISTISYNSEAFLSEKLRSLYDAHIIQAYQYIKHIGEDGDKDHIHLRIEPNRKIDVMTLSEEFLEYTLDCDKPLCCRPFRPSKEEDWYLYVVHDPDYLRYKYRGGETHEKLPYDYHDIKVSPMYDLDVAFTRAKASLLHSSSSISNRLQKGEKPIDIIDTGENPYLVNAVMKALSLYDYNRLQAEHNKVLNQLSSLQLAIEKAGFVVLAHDDGSLYLESTSK